MGKKKKIKVFDLDYLSNEEFTEDDLYRLFETPSLNRSLVIGMFRFIGNDNDELDILNLVKTKENWMNDILWSFTKKQKFRDILINISKNLYQYSEKTAANWADEWLLRYGFGVKQKKFSKNLKNH